MLGNSDTGTIFPFLDTVFLLLFLHHLSSVMIVFKACFTMWKVFEMHYKNL